MRRGNTSEMLTKSFTAPPRPSVSGVGNEASISGRYLDNWSVIANDLSIILDSLTDTVFVIKDAAANYSYLNTTLAHRLGMQRREEVIGRTAMDVYPASMGRLFNEQDRRVLKGETLENILEPQLFPNRAVGWCLTHKRPLYVNGAIQGILSFSRDLGQQPNQQSIYRRVSSVAEHIREHFAQNVSIMSLADQADMSMAQLERHFKRIFQMTPQQMQTKLRIEKALNLLGSESTVASIGEACGFFDQSAFTRRFKAIMGMTPCGYRSLLREQSAHTINEKG